jgi:tRNA A-37 threonylcarbamoyl transferase component Bud32
MDVIAERRLLSNRYRIDEFIGRGGMAAVYRGTDRVLGRSVAIKVLAEALARDPAFVQRFRREAQAAAGLGHPGVVSVFDTGSDDGIHYIVMELLEGRTLEEITRVEGPLLPERAEEIAEAVCAALAAAHGQGLVHRDVKPSNIMIASDGSVKVMDFGIARAMASDRLTQTAMTLGTATYFSPEQAQGEPVDARSDLYSLGVVLFEMLTGRPPFEADSPVAVAYKHVREDPPPPSSLNDDVSPALEAVVLRAMAKDPAVRYQTAEGMRRALGRTGTTPGGDATEQIPALRTAVLPARASPPRRRRRRWWPALVALVFTGLVVALVLSLLFAGRLADRPAATPAPSRPAASSPAPQTTAPPEEPGVPTIAGAIDALEAVLEEGQATGAISRKAAGEIARGANEALKEYDKGNLDEALEKIEQGRDRLDQMVAEGEIVSSETADQIDLALADLAAALEASPPPEGDEDD